MNSLKAVMDFRKAVKNIPELRNDYKDIRRRYLKQFKIVKAFYKTKWFLSEMLGVTCVGADGDCDGNSETYAFRFFFLECYLGSTFTRSQSAPPDVPYGISHGLEWEIKDLFTIRNWGWNSMFEEDRWS